MKAHGLTQVAILSATCGYLGKSPIAPGTVGSVVGLAVWWGLDGQRGPVAEGGAILALLVLGIWSATEAERHFGRVDPGTVIIDEVVGMLISLAFVSVSVWGTIAGFFLFRLFDIVKPFPANRAEHLSSGWGIMLDDVVAGLYANLVLRVLIGIVPGFGA